MPSFKLRGNALAWATIFSCSLCMVLFGYDQGVMSGLITAPGFKQEIFGTQTPASGISGCVVAIYEIGAFVGALGVIGFGQAIGRKKTTVLGQIITVIGAILQATSYGLGQMISARVITGFGVGILTATVPVWTAEIAPSSVRGRAAGSLTICAVLGLVISYWTDYGTSTYQSSFRYRFPLSLQIVFCVIQLATVPWLPESPRWLVASNRHAQAKEVIAAICGTDDFATSHEAVQMMANIEQAVLIENDKKPAYKDMFSMGPLQYFRRIMLAFGLQAMQQLSGINVIAYYSTVVFEQSIGKSPHTALILGGLTTIAFLCGTIVAIMVVDKMGRRTLMLCGYACTCLAMITIAIGTSKSSFSYGAAATFGIFFFNFSFGVGLQIPPWLYGVEVTPLKLRCIAGAITAASGWIWNYIVVQITQPGIENIGYKFFIIFAVLNFSWFWVVYYFYPETKQKTLEELDFIFAKPETESALIRDATAYLEDEKNILARGVAETVHMEHA